MWNINGLCDRIRLCWCQTSLPHVVCVRFFLVFFPLFPPRKDKTLSVQIRPDLIPYVSSRIRYININIRKTMGSGSLWMCMEYSIRLVWLFEAVYVCVWAGHSKMGSIVKAFETLLTYTAHYCTIKVIEYMNLLVSIHHSTLKTQLSGYYSCILNLMIFNFFVYSLSIHIYTLWYTYFTGFTGCTPLKEDPKPY